MKRKTMACYEYPLFDEFKHLCPTARYVGGVSKYLCECQQPEKCKGVEAVAEANKGQVIKSRTNHP